MAMAADVGVVIDGAALATAARAVAELLCRMGGAAATCSATTSFPFSESECGAAAAPLNDLVLCPRLIGAAAAALGVGAHGVRLVEAVLHGRPDAAPLTHAASHFGVPADDEAGEAVVAIIPLEEHHPRAGCATLIGLGTAFQAECPVTLRVTLRADFAEWVSADAYGEHDGNAAAAANAPLTFLAVHWD
eukprot:COSAG01_NODE_12504_length_1728_cov_1.316759_1_plen_190_part_00